MHLRLVLFNAAALGAAAAAASASVEERGIAPVNLGTPGKPHWVYGPPPGPVNLGGAINGLHWVFPPPPKPVADAADTPEPEGNGERSVQGFRNRRTPPQDGYGRPWPGQRRRDESESEGTSEPESIVKRFLPFWKLRPPSQDGDGRPIRGDDSGPSPKRPWPGPRRRDESPAPKPTGTQPPPEEIMRMSAQRARRAFGKQCDRLALSNTTLSAQCVTTWGEWYRTKINLNRCIGVDDSGKLLYKSEGKFGAKCSSCCVEGSGDKRALKCSCKDGSGKAQSTQLALSPKAKSPAALQVRNGHFFCGSIMGSSTSFPKRHDPRSE